MQRPNPFFPRLFTPGNIGNMVLANRIIMPGMSTNFPNALGEVTDSLVAYYTERARGGVGLIIVEHANVDYARGQAGAVQLRIDDDIFILGLHRLVESIHYWGTKVALQISHVGGVGRKTLGELSAPSPIPLGLSDAIPRELTTVEIDDIIKKFGIAAQRAKITGFDAIEIHGAHTYLISRFLSYATNKRSDEYGGNLNKRMKFALDVVSEVRRTVGKDFPIFFRLNAEDFMAEGLTLEQSKIVAQALERASIDAVDITCGGTRLGPRAAAAAVEPMSYPQGWRSYLAAEIKGVISVPVITVGVIREPEFAESLLRQNKADYVAIGRGLIADPEWPIKARKGRAETIRKCVSCNEGCSWNRSRGWPIRCTVNACVGREKDLIRPIAATKPKRICVIGGGPAGMECARIAAGRGHRVTLYEKKRNCGGQVELASVPPGKEKLRWLIEYLVKQLQLTGVEVHTNCTATPEKIREMNCDAVVLATGSIPRVPDYFVQSNHKLITAHDILSGNVVVTKQNLVVIGGGTVGCETASYLARENNKVIIIEMSDEVGGDLPPTSRWDLIERLKEYEVSINVKTKVLGLGDKYVLILTESGQTELLSATSAVLAIGVRSVNDLASELERMVPEFYMIGDARLPGKIGEAIYEGNLVGRSI